MKRIKKLLAVLLAVAMVMSMGTSVWASGDTYTLTIQSSTNSDHTYSAYQIFAGTLSSDGLTLSDVEWGSNVNTTGLASALLSSVLSIGTITYDGDDYTTLGTLMTAVFTDADSVTATGVANVLATYAGNYSVFAESFAEFIKEYISGSAAGSSSTASAAVNSSGYYEYTISGLAAGYYLVTDTYTGSSTEGNTSVSDYILKVVADTTVTSKAVYSTITKTVGDSAKSADAYIGEDLDFTLTVSVPDITDYYNGYVVDITDTLSNGLTYNTSNGVTVTIAGTDSEGNQFTITADKVDSGDNGYTLSVPSSAGGTIEAKFSDLYSYLSNVTVNTSYSVDLSKGITITITYKAALNSSAVIGAGTGSPAGNYNTVTLEYSNNPNVRNSYGTSKETVNVYSFGLVINKIDSNDTLITDSSASFILYKKVGGTENYYHKDDTTGAITWVTDSSEATPVTTSNGTVTVSGLDADTYYLKETVAPDGYNLDNTEHTIVIEATYDNTGVTSLTINTDNAAQSVSGNTETGTVTTSITNSKGSELPVTGGIGTTIFYIVGAVLVLGAGVILITRRRMASR